MNKHILSAVAALAFISCGAVALEDTRKPAIGDMPPPPPHGEMPRPGESGHGKEWTLEEARKHAHERADKLDKMTETEWAEEQKKRKEAFRAMLDKMSPEQKERFFKEKAERRQERQQGKPEAGK